MGRGQDLTEQPDTEAPPGRGQSPTEQPVDLLAAATGCTASTADALALMARWARTADHPTTDNEGNQP